MKTTVHADLADVILKYFKPSIKAEYDNGEIKYITQDVFNTSDFNTKNIMNLDILGILQMIDPKDKFSNSMIHNITGYIILIGDASSMFSNTDNFNSDISGWDTSRAKDMHFMFSDATLFNSDISRWNVSKVTDMSGMFLGATKFNSDISRWDVSNVTNMGGMFEGATKFRGKIKNTK